MSFLSVEHIAGPGPSASPAAVLLHGFTQNRYCWGQFAAQLGRSHSVWALDLPGHGSSGHPNVTFAGAVDLINETLAALPFAVDSLVGYSMGGRMALAAALQQPDLANRMVLIGATAGLEGDGERRQRRAADSELAARLRREGPEDFLDYWLALPLFAGLTADQQFRSERLEHWGSGVAKTLELRGTGSMEPLWGQLGDLTISTLVIAGAEDLKFAEIGNQLVATMGSAARFEAITGAGHACHLTHAAAVAGLLQDSDPSSEERHPPQ